MEKQLLIPKEVLVFQRRSLCNRVVSLIFAGVLATIVALNLIALYSGNWDQLQPFADEAPRGTVNWNRFTTFVSSQVNGRHFIWKAQWDQENERFRVDAVRVNTETDDNEDTVQKRVEAAKSLFVEQGLASVEGSHKFVGTPITMLFADRGIYGIYSKDGEPQCRHYEHDFDLPTLNPLDGAVEHGLAYAHKFYLTNRYTDLNLYQHPEGDEDSSVNAMNVTRSELWVDAFSSKPLAAEIQGEVERDGKTFKVEVFHHFFKWMNYVDESQVTPPKQFTGVCREVGHSGKFAGTDDIKDFASFLKSVEMQDLMLLI